MRPLFLVPAFLSACALAPPPGEHAPPEQAVLVVRRGADTVAVEWLTRTPRRVTGHVVQHRTMALDYTLHLDRRGRARLLEFSLTQPGKPAYRDRLRFLRGDEILPFRSFAYGLLEPIVARARRTGRERVPVWKMPGGHATQARVEAGRGDSVRIAMGELEMTARVDGRGRLLEAALPEFGLTVERVPTLPRQAFALQHPYGAPPGAGYRAEEVAFRTRDGVRLVGTLTLPRGAEGRVPAVVLLHGSNGADRNNGADGGALDPAVLFRQLADTLSRRGIAVLRYDKRGRGASEGRGQDPAPPVLAADAMDALAFLRTRPEVDGARLGVVGISEGAVLGALAVGEDAGVAALVLMGGPGSVGREFVEYQNRKRIELDASIPAERRVPELRRLLAELDSAAEAGHPRIAFWMDFDALATVRRVRAPVLVLHGAVDLIVPPEHSQRVAGALEEAGNEDVTVRVFDGLNHVFLRDPVGDRKGWAALPCFSMPAEVRGEIAEWLVERLR